MDVRASFTSFVPAAVDDGVASQIVDIGLSVLDVHPELHDKVEFAVMATSMTATWERDSQLLIARGLKADDVRIGYVPKTSVAVEDVEAKESLDKLLEILDDHDDVEAVYTNEG